MRPYIFFVTVGQRTENQDTKLLLLAPCFSRCGKSSAIQKSERLQGQGWSLLEDERCWDLRDGGGKEPSRVVLLLGSNLGDL